MIHFSSAPIPRPKRHGAVGRSIEKRGFCVLIRRLYAGQELEVWSIECLAESVCTAGPGHGGHNGATER
jgi:hypothetical protein